MKEFLKNKGISQTPFRLEILYVFKSHNCAIPMSTIEQSLKPYDRTTLYRTIKKFLSSGIIHEIIIPGKDKNYALCQETCTSQKHQHQHIHFNCKSCQTITCISIEKYPTVEISGYLIEQLEIQAMGVCKKCSLTLD